MTVTLADVIAARARIADAIRVTPAWPSRYFSDVAGVQVFLKNEQMQRTGSFKIRGATNFVRQLGPAEAARGLVAASAGNHAQGVALAGSERGIPVRVVMPTFAPLAKANATRGYGADVILHGNSLEEARNEARAIAEREGKLFVHPFDDDDIIAGQATLGLELLEQLPDFAEVYIPAGGGGLLAGVACAIKETRPSIRVIGVQAAAMDGIAESCRAGRLATVPPVRTIADGVAVAGPSERTFELIQRYVDDIVAVPEEAIAHAVLLLIERAKVVVEGAGALGPAALTSGIVRPRGTAVCVLSGGNIDINTVGSVLRRGLVDAGRYQQLTLEVADHPGELALITGVLAEHGVNVLEVEHNREAPDLPVGVTLLELLLEVEGRDHLDRTLDGLRAAGMRRVRGSEARLSTSMARSRHETWDEPEEQMPGIEG